MVRFLHEFHGGKIYRSCPTSRQGQLDNSGIRQGELEVLLAQAMEEDGEVL